MKTVLFVCVHNSGRSQMAEAFFNRLAGGRARAVSAGTDPDGTVDSTVVQVMGEAGIDINNRQPKALTPEMIDRADMIVAMGCGVEDVCPAIFVEAEDWELEDPKGKEPNEVREVRNKIRARVMNLLEELGIQTSSSTP